MRRGRLAHVGVHGVADGGVSFLCLSWFLWLGLRGLSSIPYWPSLTTFLSIMLIVLAMPWPFNACFRAFEVNLMSCCAYFCTCVVRRFLPSHCGWFSCGSHSSALFSCSSCEPLGMLAVVLSLRSCLSCHIRHNFHSLRLDIGGVDFFSYP